MTEKQIPENNEAISDTEKINTQVQMAYGRIITAYEDLGLIEEHGIENFFNGGEYDIFRVKMPFTNDRALGNLAGRTTEERQRLPWPLNQKHSNAQIGETRKNGIIFRWSDGNNNYQLSILPESENEQGGVDNPSLIYSSNPHNQDGQQESVRYSAGIIKRSRIVPHTWTPANLHDSHNGDETSDRILSTAQVSALVKMRGSYEGEVLETTTHQATLEEIEATDAWKIMQHIISAAEQMAASAAK